MYLLNAQQDAGQQSLSVRMSSGWLGNLYWGFLNSTAWALDAKSLHIFFTAGQCSLGFSPSPPLPLWHEDKYLCGKYSVFSVFSVRWYIYLVVATGLSWAPYTVYTRFSFCSHASPSLYAIPQAYSFVDELHQQKIITS